MAQDETTTGGGGQKVSSSSRANCEGTLNACVCVLSARSFSVRSFVRRGSVRVGNGFRANRLSFTPRSRNFVRGIAGNDEVKEEEEEGREKSERLLSHLAKRKVRWRKCV